MAKRSECLCDGKRIGIEYIYTVVDGKQINNPEKLKEIRTKSQNNELFCPCGCGSNLILVAGDKNLREQHFRLKGGTLKNDCHAEPEEKTSIDSKIVLMCWLNDKLQTDDVQPRVPISLIGDTNRKYEFSFLSQAKKIAVSYSYERANLSEEKFDILQENSNGIQLIYIVDIMNGGSNGQYPEALMKVQDRQGYCLLLEVEEESYSDAKMCAVFYAQDNNGLWEEIRFADGPLSDFAIAEDGALLYRNEELSVLLSAQLKAFEKSIEEKQREEAERKRCEDDDRKKLEQCFTQQPKAFEKSMEEKQREETERKRREADYREKMEKLFTQQQEQIKDAEGNRLIKCKQCGLIAKTDKFNSYGGKDEINLGICNSCRQKQSLEQGTMGATPKEKMKPVKKHDESTCPKCGGKLKKRNGRYGSFIGCSNYPKCDYTKNI